MTFKFHVILMEFKFCPLQNRSHENDTISKNKMEFQFKNTGEDSMLPWTDYTPIPRYTGQRENLSSRSSGGARVLDQGGSTFFSVGCQTSHVVQIGSYLKLFVTSEQ